MRLPHALRAAAARAGAGLSVRIRSGPNRGLRWSLASAGRGVWRGRFEPARIALLEAVIQPGDVVWDLGAHKGYVTLLAARRVGDAGRVLACEPASVNRRALLRHLEWNRIDNVDVEPCAVAGQDGIGRIGGSGSTIAFRLGTGPEEVSVRTLVSLARDHAPPTVLKVDVEGQEAAVLRAGGDVLRNARVVVVSVHSPALFEACLPLLQAAGFDVTLSRQLRAWQNGAPWRGDPDLLATARERHTAAAVLAAFTGDA